MNFWTAFSDELKKIAAKDGIDYRLNHKKVICKSETKGKQGPQLPSNQYNLNGGSGIASNTKQYR